ncbi:type I restriction enzyme HsdR N-terminal domain-containing protein [Methylophaga muralis]|uniref:type I restriction enzyme HsdR N-terminal domain-containing protein n=1 Tax=Methylophaga muralis TaxID=291169 RepID=UPI00114D0A76|nr:type I restriction enzyme HsdR N-terminal domain-containing protein [Methylophaga muralis]
MSKERLLNRLANLSFKSEDDVREEFVTPLLRLLGFDHVRGEVIRGKNLSTPYQSGTKRKEYIVPDYMVISDGIIHLVLDAKKPNQDLSQDLSQVVLDPVYIGQVHSYASHREVQAPYFIVTDGCALAIFDTTKTTFEPLCLIYQSELSTRYNELESIVSKKSIARVLEMRMPLKWVIPVRQKEVGFQPINIDVGDINQDGLPKIAIALSENQIPIINSRGEQTASIETSGWVWWVKCTGAQEPDEATLIAIQKDSGANDLTGRILGIQGDRIIWSHTLSRAGSGFEELDRIVVDLQRSCIVFGVACDNTIQSITLNGKFLWSVRVTETQTSGSIMHVYGYHMHSVLVTAGFQSYGVLAEIDVDTGRIIRKVDLSFRGAEIAALDRGKEQIVVSNADAGEVVLIDLTGKVPPQIVWNDPDTRNPRIAVNPELGVLLIAGKDKIVSFSIEDILSGAFKPLVVIDVVKGNINRLSWLETAEGPRILASTVGTWAYPNPNGIHVITPEGIVEAQYFLSSEIIADYGLTGIRDVRATILSRENTIDIIAVADDCQLYVWNPNP